MWAFTTVQPTLKAWSARINAPSSIGYQTTTHEAVLTGTKDNAVFHIEGQLEVHKHPPGTIVQLERVGYAKIIDKTTLMLCHEDLGES